MRATFRWFPAVASIAGAAAIARPLRQFLAEDVCLDRGGRVLRESLQCELTSDYSVPLASFLGAASGTRLLLGLLIVLGLSSTAVLIALNRREHRRASA
jgi:hypothetical protein